MTLVTDELKKFCDFASAGKPPNFIHIMTSAWSNLRKILLVTSGDARAYSVDHLYNTNYHTKDTVIIIKAKYSYRETKCFFK